LIHEYVIMMPLTTTTGHRVHLPRLWRALPPVRPINCSGFLIHSSSRASTTVSMCISVPTLSSYEHVARFLNANGFAVFAMDHQGHGQSEGI
jgi:hypothetical protein